MIGFLEVVKVFFELLITGGDVAKAYAPTAAMKEARLKRITPRLEAEEFDREVVKMARILRVRRKQTIDTLVELRCDGYDADDIAAFKKALYELFPEKRWHSTVDK